MVTKVCSFVFFNKNYQEKSGCVRYCFVVVVVLCVCVCVLACVRVCACVCVRPCVRACVHEHVGICCCCCVFVGCSEKFSTKTTRRKKTNHYVLDFLCLYCAKHCGQQHIQ